VSAPDSFVAPKASPFLEIHMLEMHMAGSHAAFSSVRKLRLAGRRIVVETILFFLKRVIHSLD
jgi:hypothetical protein